jgi:hypothetical protein
MAKKGGQPCTARPEQRIRQQALLGPVDAGILEFGECRRQRPCFDLGSALCWRPRNFALQCQLTDVSSVRNLLEQAWEVRRDGFAALEARLSDLEKLLAERTRAGKRQAAPKKLGRKAGTAFGRHGHPGADGARGRDSASAVVGAAEPWCRVGIRSRPSTPSGPLPTQSPPTAASTPSPRRRSGSPRRGGKQVHALRSCVI